MKSVVTTLLVSVFLVLSQVAQAHPGHDHSHWMSSAIHLLSVLAVSGVIVSAVVYKQIQRRRKNDQ